MTSNLLARAVAVICARNEGLFRIVLPRSLGPDFKKALCLAVTEQGGFAVPIGNGPDEMSSGEAIAYRTPEDGNGLKMVLLVASEGQTKELKSLEAYRDVLVGGMPGDLPAGNRALLQGADVAQEVARLLADMFPSSINSEKIAASLGEMLAYLSETYSVLGNAEKRWTDAFWKHADLALDMLVQGAKILQTGTPTFERDLTYACAGLPRPDSGNSYALNNKASNYVKVIQDGWSDAEDIELSLIRIQEEGGRPAETHPLRELPWGEFIASRTVHGHPILAVAFHASETAETWLHGWASTSEKAFFAAKKSDVLDYKLFQILDGREIIVPALGWKGLEHFLPPALNQILPDGTLALGRYKLRIAVDASAIQSEPSVELTVKPATACKVKIISSKADPVELVVEFELERKLPAKGGKWREKPFALTITPIKVVAESEFRESLTFTIYAPNPATPSLFVLEERKQGGVLVPNLPTDATYLVNKDTNCIESNAVGSPREIGVSDPVALSKIVVAGTTSDPVWSDGAVLAAAPEAYAGWIRTFDVPTLPEDGILVIDGVHFPLFVPLAEIGEPNPILAAVRGIPVLVNDDQLEGEINGDPRGDLEIWLRDSAILAHPSAQVRACFGSGLVETGASRSSRELRWNPGLGAFTNCEDAPTLTYPAHLAETPAARRFWAAFEALDLAFCSGKNDFSALPSMLDLRRLSREKLEAYLLAYADLLDTVGDAKLNVWVAYPFSSLLFDSRQGQAEGVLLSPLHPIRLAWCWSVQFAGSELSANHAYQKVALSFLRFIDGELFPAAGPATHGNGRWLATGISAGPREIFVGWSLLSNMPLDASNHRNSIKILGLDLPFGTPSGLDQGGVSAALRDYLRVFPAAQQLRIGLAAPRGGTRFAETDDAIIAAAGNLLSQKESRLPGGIRIVDSSERLGTPPDPSRVLARMQSENAGIDGLSMPPFEWRTEGANSRRNNVDMQFLESSPVKIDTQTIHDSGKAVGTCGPRLPVNRFRSWHMARATSDESSFALGVQKGAFSGLDNFSDALSELERLQIDGEGIRVAASLQVGTTLVGEHANWTITGNRHLNPSVLSAQLGKLRGETALWEWRPAFLSRQKQRSAINSIAATHPYTVLAHPSPTLTSEIQNVLTDCGLESSFDDVRQVIANLGIRGVGLSSLLTMGHTQSIGAIGFNLAFRGLLDWERAAEENEVRCIVPMDSVYPLLDLLGEGETTPDDQKRADLLLISTCLLPSGVCELRLHPVEVKMRTKYGSDFPAFASLGEPISQLQNTFRVLEQIDQNCEEAGELVLLRSALASLLEAAFSLRPIDLEANSAFEASVLGAVAANPVTVKSERGTILWFQVGGQSEDYLLFDTTFAEGELPGCVCINPKLFNLEIEKAELLKAITDVVDSKRGLMDELTYGVAPTEPAAGNHMPSGVASPDSGKPSPPLGDKVNSSNATAEVIFSLDSNGRTSVAELAKAARPGIEVLVGEESRGAKRLPVYFRPSETSLSQLNVGVVGDLGTGKTQFLKSLVYQITNARPSNRGVIPKVFLFDYKRDYSEGDFPEALGAQVLDPAKAPLPINFFAIDVSRLEGNIQMERVRRASFFCDLLRRISRIGIVQRNELYSCIMGAYSECPEGGFPTINDVFERYSALGKSDSVVSTLTMLTDLMVFEADAKQTKTFVELFDRSTVLNLAGLSGAGQDIVDIVATMFLDNLYTDYMKTRPKLPFITGGDGISRRQVDSFVLIDEAHHAMGREFDVLMKLMLEGREFGMGVILSSQYLSHFEGKSHDWAEALSTWVVHNVRNASPRQFERIGFRSNLSEMAENVTSLQTHWAYYRCMNGYNEGILMKGQPFFSLTS